MLLLDHAMQEGVYINILIHDNISPEKYKELCCVIFSQFNYIRHIIILIYYYNNFKLQCLLYA